jgi:ribokinase
MTKILNYGSLNIDYVYDVPHFVKAGETLSSLNRNIFAGGKGLNQSIALARAGGLVSHFGAVGKADSEILTEALKQNQIDTSFLKYRDLCSGHTIIQVDSHGQNCILLFGGSNQSLTHEEMDATLENFEAGDYLVMQNETNDLEYMLKAASKKGIKACLNVSPITEELLALPLELCHLLIVNEIEAAALSNLSEDSDPYDLLHALASKYPQSSFVLTLGSRGSIIKLQGEEAISCKSFKVKAVDTTAAGDTYLGYLIANLANGADTKTAVREATAAAALAVQVKGAAPSIPSRAQVVEFLNANPQEIIVAKL